MSIHMWVWWCHLLHTSRNLCVPCALADVFEGKRKGLSQCRLSRVVWKLCLLQRGGRSWLSRRLPPLTSAVGVFLPGVCRLVGFVVGITRSLMGARWGAFAGSVSEFRVVPAYVVRLGMATSVIAATISRL